MSNKIVVDDVTEKFLRDRLNEGLNLCTDVQQKFFHRLYPTGVTIENLMIAINQIERTLEKNKLK